MIAPPTCRMMLIQPQMMPALASPRPASDERPALMAAIS